MGLTSILKAQKRVYHEVNGVWLHKYKVDLGIHQKWSLLEKIKYNSLGFTNEDYHNFNLKHNDYHDYISFRERWRLEDINGRFAYILGEKLLFERIFGHYINVPHVNCWIKNGNCIDMESGQETDILTTIGEKKTLIAKPTRSRGGGSGIHKISTDGQQYTIDEGNVDTQQLRATVSTWEEYIIVDYIIQANYSNKIYSETTNSMRVITGRWKNGEYEVLLSFHRFGTDLSKPVDNISSGGLVAIVDIETGKLGKAKCKIEPTKLYEIHPDSGGKIEGVEVPKWKEIKEKLLHVHRCFPYYTFLAWDVVITDQGEPCILEINRGSDLTIQMIKPLRNEKLGDFMREYGLLDKR
jgi:hypothetical protein